MDILTSECKLVVQSINYNSGSEIRRLTLRAIIVRNSLFPDNILLVASWASKAGRQEGRKVDLFILVQIKAVRDRQWQPELHRGRKWQ